MSTKKDSVVFHVNFFFRSLLARIFSFVFIRILEPHLFFQQNPIISTPVQLFKVFIIGGLEKGFGVLNFKNNNIFPECHANMMFGLYKMFIRSSTLRELELFIVRKPVNAPCGNEADNSNVGGWYNILNVF